MTTRIRSIRISISLFLTLIILSHSLVANEIESTKTTIRVGYDKNYGIIDDITSLDSKGFGYEILQRAEHYSNFEFEFFEYNYWDALVALEEGNIDLLGFSFDSDLYRERFLYVPKIVATTQLILATKGNNIYYDNPKSINGKTVATYEGNPYEKYLDAYCAQNNITVTYLKGDIDSFINIPADFYLITTINNNASDLRMVLSLEVFDLYFLTGKNQGQLAEDLATAMRLSVSADGNFFEELQIKYYGAKNLSRRSLTQRELDLLRSKTLVCGYIDHHQPIQFTNENGEADGINVDIMNMLAEKYGFTIEYVPYNHNMPNSSHENFDMIISATGDIEHEMSHYTPTEAFMNLPLMLFTGTNNIEQILSENYHSALGMLNYITIDYHDVEGRYPSNTLKSFDLFESLFDAYITGDVEGILATENGVEFAQAVLGDEKHLIQSTGLTLPLRVFFSSRSEYLTEYLGAFNIMFEHIEQTTLDEIVSMQSVRFLPEYSALSFIKEYFVLLISIVLLILLVIISIIFYHQYKRKSAILEIINNDTLTELISPYNFSETAKLVLQSAKEGDYEVIVFDIDGFRTINAIYSKNKGDLVIKAVARALDIAYKGTETLISRIIADQFVILHRIDESTKISKICDDYISVAIKSVMGENYNLSLSFGICVINDMALAIDTIIDHAVAAHTKGKNKYGITYNVYNEEIEKEIQLKTNIVYRMKDALLNNEFKVFYQPKILFDSFQIGGAEALVRWFDENNTMVSTPDVFIGIFESNGFIVNLDLRVFEEVCKFITQNDRDLSVPLISVNVSTVTLFDDCFPVEYFNIIKKYKVDPQKLEIEITESATTLDQKVLIEKAKQVRDFGLQLSIDDFGAGESSLNRLNAIVADTIKLDKAFLDYNITEERGSIVVDTVIKMAKQLNMKVVSEGVETVEQVKWLKSLNCDYAQGYFFEKPMKTEDFQELLRSNKTYVID